jgi:hypothetical protein
VAHRTKVTPERIDLFLELLATFGGNVTKAADACDLSRMELYRTRWEDDELARRWDEAVKIGTAALEDEAMRRAHDGVEEPVWHQGQQCGVVRKYSDTLMIFMLKARDDKYRDRQQVELSGTVTVASALDAATARLKKFEDDGSS